MRYEPPQSILTQDHLKVEQLEDRLLLAGNVALGLIAGPGANLDVSLTGDAASNSVSMTTTGSGAAAELTIAALDGTQLTLGAINIPLPVLAGLIVNTDFDGVSATFITFNDVMVDAIAGSLGINTDVSITLGGGNDTLTVTNSEIGGDLSVDMGADDDSAHLGGNQFDGDVTVHMGSGNDQLVNSSNQFGDNAGPFEYIDIAMGSGDDYYLTGGNLYTNTTLPIIDGGPAGHDIIVKLDSVPLDQFVNTAPSMPNWELIDEDYLILPPPFVLPA